MCHNSELRGSPHNNWGGLHNWMIRRQHLYTQGLHVFLAILLHSSTVCDSHGRHRSIPFTIQNCCIALPWQPNQCKQLVCPKSGCNAGSWCKEIHALALHHCCCCCCCHMHYQAQQRQQQHQRICCCCKVLGTLRSAAEQCVAVAAAVAWGVLSRVVCIYESLCCCSFWNHGVSSWYQHPWKKRGFTQRILYTKLVSFRTTWHLRSYRLSHNIYTGRSFAITTGRYIVYLVYACTPVSCRCK